MDPIKKQRIARILDYKKGLTTRCKDHGYNMSDEDLGRRLQDYISRKVDEIVANQLDSLSLQDLLDYKELCANPLLAQEDVAKPQEEAKPKRRRGRPKVDKPKEQTQTSVPLKSVF